MAHDNGGKREFRKILGDLNPLDLIIRILHGGYREGQVLVERELLMKGERMTRKQAGRVIHEWRGALRRWIKTVMGSPYNCVAGWGSASDDALTALPGTQVVIQLIEHLGSALVGGTNTITGEPRHCGLVHGSSTTGLMNIWDLAWFNSKQLFRAAFVPVWNIALSWIDTDRVREIPAKRSDKAERCPPQLHLPTRTELFGLVRPRIFFIGFGGWGSLLESTLVTVSMQMSSMLLTMFTGAAWHPQIVFLDFLIDKGDLPASLKDRPEAAKLEGSWFWGGMVQLLRTMVIGKTISQATLKNVWVLRVGSGTEISGPDHLGPAIIYRPTVQEAAEWAASLYDECVAKHPDRYEMTPPPTHAA